MRANATSEENQRRIERYCRKEERGGGKEVVENKGRDKVGETGSGRDRDKGDGEIEGEREKMGERETMREEK